MNESKTDEPAKSQFTKAPTLHRPRKGIALRQNAEPARRAPDAWKGALAGLIGGLAGTAAKVVAEKIYPPRVEGRVPPAPVVLAEKVAGHHLDRHTQDSAMQGIHWMFGPLMGAAYGVAVEYEPRLTARNGAAFGVGLNGLTHESLLPVLGLAEPVKKQPAQQRWSEISSHVVYGVVTETVRRMVRGRSG